MSALAATEPVGGSEIRVLRALTAIQSGGAALALLYAVTVMRADLRGAPAGFAVIALTPWVLSVLGIAVVPSRSRTLIRGFNVVAATWYVFSVAALLAGTAAGLWRPTGVPWLMARSTIAAAAAVTGSGAVAAVAITLGLFFGTEALRGLDGDLGIPALVDDSHLLFFGLMVAGLAEFIAAARRHDEVSRRAADAVAAASAASASRTARERMEALVHDEVFTALLLGSSRLAAAAGPQATRALALIERVEASGSGGSVTPADLLERFGRLARQIAPSAYVRHDRHADALTVPAYVADALTDAAGQALANAVKHAPGARIDLEVEITGEGVRVRVIDDGPGFRRTAVPNHRMGIAVSILGRVNALPGASARVVSQPQRGTAVTLSWHPSAERPTATGSSDHRSPMRNTRIAVAALLLGQLVLGTLALADGARPDVVLLGYAGIAAGLLVLDWHHLRRPTPVRTAVSVGCCWLVGSLGWAPAAHNGEAADWYLIGMGVVASAVAIRGRPLGAALAVGGGVALGASGLLARHATMLPNRIVFTTPVPAVLWAITCWSVLRGLRDRTARLAEHELAEVDRSSADSARIETLAERVREITTLVAPTLTRLATTETIPLGLAIECRALEGRLRDEFRGGRLARQPLVDAAHEARLRGVDVVLLDDGDDRELSESTLAALRRWMADELSTASAEGRFTGRILPTGREGIATAVTPERAAVYSG